HELAGLLAHSEPVLVVAGPEYVETARELADEVLAFGGEDEALLASAAADEPEAGPDTGDPFAILDTSRTTRLPRGAVGAHRDPERNAYTQAIADKADPDDVTLTATPLYHMGALFMATTYTSLGCTNVVLERFDPAEVLRTIERERATTCLLVPTML